MDTGPDSVERETRQRETTPLLVDVRLAQFGRSVAVATLALILAVALLVAIWFLLQPLAIFFVAIIIAETLAPVVARLQRYLPRMAAIILVFAVLVLLLVGMMIVVVPPLIGQVQSAVHHLPQLLHRLGSLINHVAPGNGNRVVTAIEPALLTFVNGASAPPLTVLEAAAIVVQVLFLSIYWLIASPALFRFTLGLLPPQQQPRIAGILHDVGQAIGGYVRGTVIDAAAVAVITYIGLLLIGVKYALVLALIAFLGEFVPFIGPTVAQFVAAGLALLSSPLQAVATLVFYMVLQQIDGNVILPLAVRTQTNISPLLITLSVFAGAWTGGIVGALIAVPVAAALQVIVVHAAAPLLRDWTGANR